MIPLSCIAIVYTFLILFIRPVSTYNYGYKLPIYLFKDSEQCNAAKAWSVYVCVCVCVHVCVCERERKREKRGRQRIWTSWISINYIHEYNIYINMNKIDIDFYFFKKKLTDKNKSMQLWSYYKHLVWTLSEYITCSSNIFNLLVDPNSWIYLDIWRFHIP